MLLEVVKAEYVSGYKINLRFNNEEMKIVDLRNTIFNDHRQIFQALQDINYFKQFEIVFNTIAWENGLDLAPEYLYELEKSNKLVTS
jgi:pyoverdine/dityrosine biosynthesis protein Dit1